MGRLGEKSTPTCVPPCAVGGGALGRVRLKYRNVTLIISECRALAHRCQSRMRYTGARGSMNQKVKKRNNSTRMYFDECEIRTRSLLVRRLSLEH